MSTSSCASLPERIEQLIHDIEAIKAELRQPNTDPKTGLAVPKVPIPVINHFKYAVDQLRLFLWAYQDAWAQGALNPEQRLQQIRTEAAADILRTLGSEFSHKGVPATPEVMKLREQLRTVGALLSAAA
jgi:hypothetical protein